MLGCGTCWPSDWKFLYQRFSSPLGSEACQFRNQQSRTRSGGVQSGTRGPSLFLVIRSPGVIKPATVINEIFSQEDTLLAAAGESNVVQKLEQGYKANGKTGKIHLDGYNFLPYFKGETKNGPAKQSCTWAKAGELNAVGGMTGK